MWGHDDRSATDTAKRAISVLGVVAGSLIAVLLVFPPALTAASNVKCPILMGGVGPLSLPGTVQGGKDMRWGMQTAVADLNRSGGLLGCKVKLDFEDNRGLPDVAVQVAQKLIGEHVVGVVGDFHSASALPQVAVYTKVKMPFIVTDAWNDKITGGDPANPQQQPVSPPTTFRISPWNSYANGALIQWLHLLHAKRIAEIYEATDYGTNAHATLVSQLEGSGIDLAGSIQVQVNQPDYRAVLTRFAQQVGAVDVVSFDVSSDSSFAVEQNAFDVGLVNSNTKCFADSAAGSDTAFWKAVPSGAGCVFPVVGPVPSQFDALTKRLAASYQKQFGSTPQYTTYLAYDGIQLLADAIRRAKSVNGLVISHALERTHYKASAGKYFFAYGSQRPVPKKFPSSLWHQFTSPVYQLVEYTTKNQPLADAAIVWPPSKQTKHGVAYIQPTK